jgi:signal transduction histidine kinase
MNKGISLITAAVLGGAILLISVLHYLTPIESPILHEIYQRLYYIPIVLAALWFGVRGGFAAALIAGFSYLPHIALHWQHQNYDYALNQYAEIAMFFVIGIVTGWLGDRIQGEHARAEKINEELQRAYSELRQTVGQLLQAERLSSMAEIASGVVHEVRNPLGAIKGAVEILEVEIPEDSPRREFARIAKVEVERIDKLVQEFLRVARPPKLSKAPTNLNALVESMIMLLDQQAAARSISLNRELVAGLPVVLIDPEQITQVLMNLAMNAIEAAPDGGVVVFRTREDEHLVILEVEDNGGGIAPEAVDRIFDPFFTTKNKGSGLGLSVAQKIVLLHGGKLTAKNTPKGAVFSLIINKLQN